MDTPNSMQHQEREKKYIGTIENRICNVIEREIKRNEMC